MGVFDKFLDIMKLNDDEYDDDFYDDEFDDDDFDEKPRRSLFGKKSKDDYDDLISRTMIRSLHRQAIR